MKSPFRKFRDLAINKHGSKQKDSSLDRPGEAMEITHNELAKQFEALSITQSKYEGFLTHGQTVSAAAFDFSCALREMGLYMIDTFGNFLDGEIGNAFNMLAKVQIEISKLLDLFTPNVSQTFVKPFESMIKQLQEAEVLQEAYNEKWKSYNLLQSEKQKNRLRKGKGSRKSEEVKEDIRKHANFANSHIQSMFEYQSKIVLTQLAKFHTAEQYLFSKGLVSINAVAPVITQLAQDRDIDKTLPEEIPDDNLEYKVEEELRSDAETNSAASSPRVSKPPFYSSESSGEFNFDEKRLGGSSKSAPLSPSTYHKTKQKYSEGDENQMNSETCYVLPSPTDARSRFGGHHTEVQAKESFVQTEKAYFSGNILEGYKSKAFREDTSVPKPSYFDEVLPTNRSRRAFSNHRFTEMADEGGVRVKRYSHSGPFMGKSHAKVSYTSPKNTSTEDEIKSGAVRSPIYNDHTISLSPPTMASPQISELHKLPLPPVGSRTPNRSPSPSLTQFSAPLQQREPLRSSPASPLPPPPPQLVRKTVTRSLSIPSSNNSVQGD